MSETNEAMTPDEYEAILPIGWTGSEDSDIFDPATWVTSDAADAQQSENATTSGEAGEGSAEAPTTEQETDAQAESGNGNAPTTEQKTGSDKLRFRARIDHADQDIELDPADLPTIYQKAQALDRSQRRLGDIEKELSDWDALAQNMEYADRAALRSGIIDGAIHNYLDEHPGVPEDMARDYIMRKMQGSKVVPKQDNTPAADADTESEEKPNTGGRDFKKEVADLFTTYAEARNDLPKEVTDDAVVNGKPLVRAYADYLARKSKAEAEKAKEENRILKQNQAAAAKAPVTKLTGGGNTDTKPTDDFLAGFNSDSW